MGDLRLLEGNWRFFLSMLRETRAREPAHSISQDVAVVLASTAFFNQPLIRLNES